MGDSRVGSGMRLMSAVLRSKPTIDNGAIGKTNTVCIFINQLLQKVEAVYATRSHHKTHCGRARILASACASTRCIEGLKDSTGALNRNAKLVAP